MTVTPGAPWPPEDDRATRSGRGRHRPAGEREVDDPPARPGPPEGRRSAPDGRAGPGGGTRGWEQDPPHSGHGAPPWRESGTPDAFPARPGGVVGRPARPGRPQWSGQQPQRPDHPGRPDRVDPREWDDRSDPGGATGTYQITTYRPGGVHPGPPVEDPAADPQWSGRRGRPEVGGGRGDPGVGSPARSAGGRRPTRAAVRRRRQRVRRLELPLLIVFSLVTALLVRTFGLQTFYIPSGSMHPTLLEGDRVIVNKLSYRLHDVHRGDVVVFRRPPKLHINDEDLIKRVIGLPGDTVAGHDRKVFVNGRALKESYIPDRCVGTADFLKVTVPSDRIFVMGDNRCDSTDSRVFGPISEDLLVGRAFSRIWPPSRVGWL